LLLLMKFKTQVMRNLFLITIAFAAFSLIFSGCTKYEDGPKISILSAKSKISKDWTLYKIYDEDGKEESYIPVFTFSFTKEGAFEKTFITTTTGTREIDGANLTLTYTTDLGIGVVTTHENYTIDRLSGDELWLIDKNDGSMYKDHELRFILK